jgi:hypothetical protein
MPFPALLYVSELGTPTGKGADMARQVVKGQFYEFDAANTNYEIGSAVSERDAQFLVRSGKDVYTPSASDAKSLSKNVDPTHPEWHPAHKKGYFPHYHPADSHPELLPSGKKEGYGHIFYGERGEYASEWKAKTAVAKVGGVSIWGVEGERTFFFKAGMQIDADGAPNAYHPGRTRGLDNLDNAGRPGNWWALATDNGRPTGNPIIQGPRDPAPTFYVSTTALENPAWPPSDPRRYVDSTAIPYFVLPRHTDHILGVRLGDTGFVINTANKLSSPAIYADVGPAHEIGEGSIALAKALEINSNPRGGGTDGGVIYILFAGSGNGSPRSVEQIKSVAAAHFQSWGGVAKLQACFPEYGA